MGWSFEQVVVIDSDLGQSGADADREGFKKLVADVGLGLAGIVISLEVSRLARSSADWHRLLEICALTDTLIMDEDGIYDSGNFNDRLILGLKGTMSEAELHLLKARMRGGQLSKASRGELKIRLPIGFVYDSEDKVVLDPDIQIQQAIRTFFETFESAGSAYGTLREFNRKGLMFPRRVYRGPHSGEIVWAPMAYSTTRHILHNPRYAGAYFYGRTRWRTAPQGGYTIKRLPREEWHALLPNHHPGYITWEQFEANQRRLSENKGAYGGENRKTPPREGPALLQGLVICGACGKRMTIHYHYRKKYRVPDYVCQRDAIENGHPRICQRIRGKLVDNAIGELLIESMTPMALEVTLAVREELAERAKEADNLRLQQVERARYQAELARRRYLKVDPDNRLVAGELEANWNRKLRELSLAQEEYERQSEKENYLLNEGQREKIASLAADFPALWRDPNTPDRERKRMVRLLLEDVTLIREGKITAHIRFKGGATKTLELPEPVPVTKSRVTDPAVIKEIDQLLDYHTDAGVARTLCEKGITTYEGRPFDSIAVRRLRIKYQLKDRYSRLRESGLLTVEETGNILSVNPGNIMIWRRKGLLVGHTYNDRGECLFEAPGDDVIRELSTRIRSAGRCNQQVSSNPNFPPARIVFCRLTPENNHDT
ncbi:MAG: recombinase family protein [Actinobacteria bacterium]|nr:recombinase family protein [Actinomycetota bacterium]MBU4403483.1 recombinase family protein [Actinomycetota bacterium]MCG2817574.1 recombinase family protein [Actinomycetes bacterium]